MTEQPQRTQLSPEEWKQLCLLNVAQLQTHLQNLPPVLEGGTSAMTAQQIDAIEAHLTRGRSFLNAWARSKPLQTAPQQAAPDVKEVAQQANGAEPPKRRGGWQKGRARKPKAAEQDAA